MSVYQKNGKWYYNFMVNKRRYHKAIKGCQSHKEAIKVENSIKADLCRGIYNHAEKQYTVTFFEMVDKYLEYAEVNKSKDSFAHDKFYVKYFKDYFKNVLLNEIKPIDIEGYKKHRLLKVKESTVNRELNSLSKLFSIATQNGYIPSNPCHEVKKLKVENLKIRFLTLEEETRLFKAIEGHWIEPIVVCALQTGMRKGEILDLKWSCVNFTQRYIDVLKTKNGKPRQIPMSQKLHDTLNNMSRLTEYCFVNEKTLGVQQNINHIFPDFLKKAKIDNFRFHDLRHTVATRMVEKGADLVVVMDLLGHSDIKTTMRYAHPVPEMKLKAINSLNDYYINQN